MPPRRLSAILAPMLATEPVTCPKDCASVLAKPKAAVCTSESVKIFPSLSFMDWMLLWIESNTDVSPKASQKPLVKESFNWFSRSAIFRSLPLTISSCSGSVPISKSSAL